VNTSSGSDTAERVKGDPVTRPRLLTTADLADELQIPEGTLRQWRHAGRGPQAVRLEGTVRYERETVDQWLRAQGANTAPRAA
jgi:hypothetical protein